MATKLVMLGPLEFGDAVAQGRVMYSPAQDRRMRWWVQAWPMWAAGLHLVHRSLRCAAFAELVEAVR